MMRQSVENYIVRIYRRDADDPECVAGTVECVESQIQRPFSSMHSLEKYLSGTIQNRVGDDKDGLIAATNARQ